jgi:L-rhamnonate dehydratase
MAAATVIRRVLAHRLPPQQAGRAPALPHNTAAAVLPAEGAGWAEHRHRYALELVGDSVSGWYGPLSEAVLTLIRDQHAAGLVEHDAAHHRRLPYRPTSGRHRSGAHARLAYSAVELACWDLAGRAAGCSVTELLGGVVQESVPAYASALGLDPIHPAAAETAAWLHAEGFWGQKWPLPKSLLAQGPSVVADCLAALREAAPDARLMVDGLGGARVDQAVALFPVLESVGVTWAEELLPPESPGWSRLSGARGRVPLAAGEHAYDAREQTRLLASGDLDVWQVDVGWCGGLSRALHTVEVAAEHELPTFPHGDGLSAALALAGTCCRDKVPAVEYHVTLEPVRQSIARTPLAAVSGHLAVRRAPGLSDGLHLDTGEPALVLTEEGIT